jgi:hypothetical protein
MEEAGQKVLSMEMIVLPRLPRRKTLRSGEEEAARRRKAGPTWDRMQNYLMRTLGSKFTNNMLLKIAKEIATARGLVIDREAKRSKGSMICWFCENCAGLIGSPTVAPTLFAETTFDDWDYIRSQTPDCGVQDASEWFWI